MPQAPWSKYRDSKAWKTFDHVAHVTHIAHAVSVVATKEIAPRLIRDQSILRSERIEVVWLSPNDWFRGYRYGNIAFNYRWKDLLADKRCYWVEATKHSPVACRFLITDVKYPLLKRYYPETDTGPWRYRSKTNRHQFNGNLTMEFMFEGEIPLTIETNVSLPIALRGSIELLCPLHLSCGNTAARIAAGGVLAVVTWTGSVLRAGRRR